MVYTEAPWTFKGRALYQLQLVKTEEARKYIPEDFKLVEAFGYTLGGFYLARYEDSPVGTFDEMVALAGLIWNPPTSCAWAGRVYVSNREARDHGITHVGLPSRLASFRSVSSPVEEAQPLDKSSWWNREPESSGGCNAVQIMNVDRTRGRGLRMPVCTFILPGAPKPGEFSGPRIKMALPSFSGGTSECPNLLRYSCDLWTNVRFVSPARVVLSEPEGADKDSEEVIHSILGGKPLIAMEFSNMEMLVQEPEVLPSSRLLTDSLRPSYQSGEK